MLIAILRLITGKDKLQWFICLGCFKHVLRSAPKKVIREYKCKYPGEPVYAICENCEGKISSERIIMRARWANQFIGK